MAKIMPEGESAVASMGAMVALTLGLAVAASAWWVVRVHQRAQDSARVERARLSAGLLSQSVPELLAEGNLAGARRVLSDAAAQNRLNVCRVELADGTVVADALDSKQVTLKGALPEKFPAGKNVEETGEGSPGRMQMEVAGRGRAYLLVEADGGVAVLSDWEAQVGVGLIALCGFGGLLVSYRMMRRRLRGLAAIRGALAALERGDNSAGVLRVGEGLGPEASAWNKMLEEREKMRQQMAAGKAGEKMTAKSGRESDLSSGFDAMWHGVLFVDEGLKVRYCNGAASVLLGCKRDQLSGSEAGKWIPEKEVVEAISSVVGGRARGKTVVEVRRTSEQEGTGPRLDDGGERRGKQAPMVSPVVLRFSVRPMRREDSASVIVLIEDVTQQRVADEARNAFVSQAAHELRTPLTNVRLYVEQLVDEGEADPKTRANCINVISQEARRLERIVGDMLSVAEIEAGSMKLHRGDCRIGTVFEELEQDYRALAAAKEITLKFDLPPKWPVLQGDRDKIVMALHNLVGNAIKYTPSGGEVTVRAKQGTGAFEVEVIDNGIGIREEECGLIFEKFYRAKDKRIANITGSGIGLALAREVVRLHGGDITVRSAIDKGSTFTLTLPCAAQAA